MSPSCLLYLAPKISVVVLRECAVVVDGLVFPRKRPPTRRAALSRQPRAHEHPSSGKATTRVHHHPSASNFNVAHPCHSSLLVASAPPRRASLLINCRSLAFFHSLCRIHLGPQCYWSWNSGSQTAVVQPCCSQGRGRACACWRGAWWA